MQRDDSGRLAAKPEEKATAIILTCPLSGGATNGHPCAAVCSEMHCSVSGGSNRAHISRLIDDDMELVH